MKKSSSDAPRRPLFYRLFPIVSGAALLVVEMLLFQNGANPVGGGITCLVAYLCVLFLLFLFKNRIAPIKKAGKGEDELSDAGSFSGMAVLRGLPFPVLLCRGDGEILWVNAAMDKLSGGELRGGTGQNLRLLFPSQNEKNLSADRLREGGELRLYDRTFSVRIFSSPTRSQKLYAVILEDREEINRLRAENRKTNTVVCYLMIDNLDDLLRMSGGGGHRLLAAIGEELNRFAEQQQGILQEISRDKYCILFSEEALSQLCRSRFPILERIAAIHLAENTPVAVTASLGVSQTSGSLSEKEQSAQAALNYALQDGGACAMVKMAGKDYVKYGGNKKAVQSSSKVRSRTEAERLLREIDASDQVIVMGHRSADYDCLASSIGAARLAISRKIPTYVVLNRGDYNVARALPLLQKIPDFDKVFLDAGMAQEKLTGNTLLIITDVNNPELLASPSLENCAERVAYIDHHRRSEDFRSPPVLNYIDSNASSASELLSEMLEACLPKRMLSVTEAELLLAGIILDTKSFTVGAGPRTFGAAQFLKSIGADPARVQAKLFSPDMEQFRRQSAFESGAVFYREGIVIAANRDDGITPGEDSIGAMAADHLLTVRGVEASFVLFRIGNTVRIKARSGGKINVQSIMTAMGGGGHFEAAAHSMADTDLDDAEQKLKKAIDDYFQTTLAGADGADNAV